MRGGRAGARLVPDAPPLAVPRVLRPRRPSLRLGAPSEWPVLPAPDPGPLFPLVIVPHRPWTSAAPRPESSGSGTRPVTEVAWRGHPGARSGHGRRFRSCVTRPGLPGAPRGEERWVRGPRGAPAGLHLRSTSRVASGSRSLQVLSPRLQPEPFVRLGTIGAGGS